MAEKEVKLMKGNEVIAHAAIRYGCDGYFGYPITPQSEVMETLMELKPWETTGMVVLQAESEVSSINMVYGAAATGKRVMTSSSSPGISLMAEGLSYLAGAELPCLVVNCQRGGPGLGTIQPSQGDYFQAVKGGGHGDYHLIVLAPNSVQEMHDPRGPGLRPGLQVPQSGDDPRRRCHRSDDGEGRPGPAAPAQERRGDQGRMPHVGDLRENRRP